MISGAINTGVLPDADKLSEALNTVRGSIASTAFATRIDQIKANLTLANELQLLQDIAEPQLSAAEQAVVIAQDQLIALDAQLEQAQLQVDLLRGVNTGVMSLAEAIAGLQSAISAEKAAVSAAASVASGSAQSAGSGMRQGGYTLQGNTLYFPGGGEHNVAGEEGRSLLMQAYGLVPDGSGGFIRTRAKGGYTPTGMTLVGEEGPELVNFDRPGMVYNAAQTSSLMQGSSSGELAAIREELAMLRAETRAVVSNTGKTSRILDRATQEGDALLVVVQA